jgi:hypothetical protein
LHEHYQNAAAADKESHEETLAAKKVLSLTVAAFEKLIIEVRNCKYLHITFKLFLINPCVAGIVGTGCKRGRVP